MKPCWRVFLAVLFLTSGIHAMAAPNEKPVGNPSNVMITLDVFSGRPNPTWSLSEPMTAEFLRRLHALEPAKVDAPEFDDLGYRAVIAEFQDQTKGTTVVKASRGFVKLNQDGQQSRYTDVNRQFELWLVNTGASHVAPDVLRYVTGEIASKPR